MLHTTAGKSSNWRYPRWTVLAVAVVIAVLIACVILVFHPRSRYPKYHALMDGIDRGDLAAVKAELDKGTDPNVFPSDYASVMDDSDIAPLNYAVMIGNIEAVKVLLAHHADPNYYDGNNDYPLAAAAKQGNIQMMKLLVANGAKINDDVVSSSSYALWLAAMEGQVGSVEFLLAHRANPNSSRDGETLLHALKGMQPNAEIVTQLKKAGAKE